MYRYSSYTKEMTIPELAEFQGKVFAPIRIGGKLVMVAIDKSSLMDDLKGVMAVEVRVTPYSLFIITE
jgi:hypothetical protein